MKTIEIENKVEIWDNDVAVAFIQLMNTTTNAQSKEELEQMMKLVPHITSADLFFVWGFGTNHWWLKQRKERRSDELLDKRIMIVRFQ